MWRWISRIEGANNQLLGRTHDEQQRFQERLVNCSYGSTEAAERMARDVVAGAATMRLPFMMPARMHRAVISNLLAPQLVEVFESQDLPGDLGNPRDRPAELAVRTVAQVLAVPNQVTRIPVVRRAADRRAVSSRGARGHTTGSVSVWVAPAAIVTRTGVSPAR